MKGVKTLRLAFIIVLVVPFATAGDNAIKPLRSVVNSKGYMVADPAISWAYPGGFLVANNKSATFIDLPADIPKPTPQDLTADFFAEKENKKFSLSAMLTGMIFLIGGNPGGGFGHTSSLTFQELKASGSRITYSQALTILNNSNSQPTVKQWLSRKGTRVFLVASVLTSNKLSVSADSTWNADFSFNGSSISKCSDSTAAGGAATGSSHDSNSGSSNSSTVGTASNPTTPQSSSSNTASGNSSTAASIGGSSISSPNKLSSSSSNGSNPNSSPTNANSSSQLGGELHICSSNSKTVSMSTDSPLVFAASAYEITMDKATGALDIDPILGTSPSGTFEEEVVSQKKKAASGNNILKKIKPNWTNQPWPGQPN